MLWNVKWHNVKDFFPPQKVLNYLTDIFNMLDISDDPLLASNYNLNFY